MTWLQKADLGEYLHSWGSWAFDGCVLTKKWPTVKSPEVLITRDPHGRAGNSMSLFNADVILIRRSWSLLLPGTLCLCI